MKTSRVVLTTFAVAFACFVAAIAAQSGDRTTTVTLIVEGMT
jgi:hypothetical protein